MSMELKDKEKQKSLDLAEEARQTEWKFPSFVAELFAGNFRWDLMHPFPIQDPDDKKVGDDLIAKVRDVLEKYIDPDKVDRDQDVPEEALKALAEIGCFGMKVPKEYGGMGLSITNYSRVVSFVASYCQSTAIWLSAHQSIGLGQPLLHFGTEEQKKKYLPRLAKGEVSAFALTEPDVGSDPASMKTTATPTEDGKYYIINGDKLWITNGPVGQLLIVMARTPDKIVKGKPRAQITAFIVEGNAEGFSAPHRCRFMGVRGIMNGMLRFDNVKVPVENMVGKPGEGLKIALTTLNTGRMTIPATCAASGKSAMHWSKDWANDRVQWGASVGKHQNTGVKLARMVGYTFAMDSINTVACVFADKGGADIRLEAAMAKYFCTEWGWKGADDYLQVRGGRGYETADSLIDRGELPIPVERLLRDNRIARIIEGTSEIMQLFIAREAMDLHVRQIMPIMDPRTPFGKRISMAVKAAVFYVPWMIKMYLPAGGDYNVKQLNAANRKHLSFIANKSKKLARNLFFTMGRYQVKLEREQLVMACFVDIGTDLFAMAATLAHAESRLSRNPNDKAVQDLADMFCQLCEKRIKDNFRDAWKNANKSINKVSGAFLKGEYDSLITDIYTDIPPEKRARWEAIQKQKAAQAK
ncbi:MAG TPA: acyl-CoA dehydrogenase family protein [Candidatus Hydrogenedentes bacterium]|nr:acyl-CoA dehydrogenase family protein [Candidatus Hydrogenedentota bacterium]HPG66847.1 acyl-CoA dehydrogenase family protein [Candidatus Hydrogenedentota bacterium]